VTSGEAGETPFSGEYWVVKDGREYAVSVQPASLPIWVYAWERGSLMGSLLMEALVRRRHHGPPWSVVVLCGRKAVHRREFADLSAANEYGRKIDHDLCHFQPPPVP
jgi:hypothetical protein